MSEPSATQDAFVLPQPKRISRQSGMCYISAKTPIEIRVDDKRIASHVLAWFAQFSHNHEVSNDDVAEIFINNTSELTPQAYRLRITPQHIWLEGGAAVGCFYGLQTIKQLCALNGYALPCCVIEDEPDFPIRSVLHDVTRGKVPTLATLKHIVDRLALLKINQLQLYIEHAFAFSFDPDICTEGDGLTPGDARTLDQYCRERFIDLVPAVANLGHMGRILSLAKYRPLAEIGSERDWCDMDWLQRARGMTLAADHSASITLVEHIWRDILAAFSSPVVNICGDEPWDLGRGGQRESLTDEARLDLYLDHISRVTSLCERDGRRVQLWSDVLRNHPSSCSRLPDDLSILHWGYDDEADYEATSFFVEQGYSTIVCPGTSGWKRIVNAMDLAERNTKTFARVGRQAGADGLLVTDWGDHGHFNLLACSWHGITLGASLGWHVDHATGESFDEIFSCSVADNNKSELLSSLRRASAIAETCETWRVLWQSMEMLRGQDSLPREDELVSCIQSSKLAANLARKQSPTMYVDDIDLSELAVACRINALAAQRMLWVVRKRSGLSNPAKIERLMWSEQMMVCLTDYESCWRRRNKETGLSDIHAAITLVVEEVRKFSNELI